MQTNLYYYNAKIVSVYDGDTVRADIDLGMRVWIRDEKIRLARINTPELRGEERPAGLAARDFLRELILEQDILIETIKDRKGKYGRYLAEIWLQADGEWKNINDFLVESGHAVYQEY